MQESQATDLLLREHTQLHSVFWGQFNKFAGAIVAVSIIPYVKTDIRVSVLVFPILAFVMSIACAWFLAAHLQRLRMIRKKYDELFPEPYRIPRMPRDTWWERQVARSVGSAAVCVFLFVLPLLCIVNAVVLRK